MKLGKRAHGREESTVRKKGSKGGKRKGKGY